MRVITISFCAFAFSSTPALAGNPIAGVGVSEMTDPGGTITHHNNIADARAACTTARGTFSNLRGRLVCSQPHRSLHSTARQETLPAHGPFDPRQY
jgi:hypothetical protein